MYFRLYFCFLFGIIQTSFFAQSNLNSSTFYQINVSSGLASDFINQTIKDKQGFLWIATTKGLSRYDGNSIRNYYHDPLNPNSICDNHISAMSIDSKNRLWLGCFNKGVSCMDLTSGKILNYISGVNCKISKNEYITSVYHDTKGQIWVTAWGAGLYRFDEKKNDFIAYVHSDKDSNSIYNNEVKYITQDKSGAYWVGIWAKGKNYHSGINLFIPEQNKFVDIIQLIRNKALITDKVKAILKFIHSIYCDSKGNIWVSGYEGCARINLSKNELDYYHLQNENKKYKIESQSIRFVTEYNGKIVLCSPEGGLYFLNDNYEINHLIANEPSRENSLSSNNVIHVFIDQNQTLFASTIGGGLNIMKSGMVELEYIPNQTIFSKLKSYDKIRLVSNIDSDHWLIGGTKLLSLYNQKTKETKPIIFDETQDFIANFKFNSFPNKHYVSSKESLFEYDIQSSVKTKFNFKPIENNQSNFESANGVVHWNRDTFLVTHLYSGLMRYVKYQKQYYRYKIDYPNFGFASSILKLDDQHVLLGFKDGILKFNIYTGKTVELMSTQNKAKVGESKGIFRILKDTKNRIWFTNDSGLAKLNYPNQGYKQYSISTGVLKLYYILEDKKGNLWVNSNYKIYNFNPESEEFNLVSSDKMKSTPFCPFQMDYNPKTGIIMLGSEGGVYKVNTDLFYDSSIYNKIKLTDLSYRLDDSTYEVNIVNHTEIDLSYKSTNISFNVTNFDFIKSKEYKLVYKLEGFDNDWKEVNNGSKIDFINLPSGDYTLRIRYSILNDHPTEASLKIHVSTPFYKMIWFYILSFLALVLSALAWTKFKTKQLESQKLELESKVNERTKELKVEKEKSDNLLLNILPQEIADELKEKGKTIAKQHESVTVLFTDFVNFTGISSDMSPADLVNMIDLYFREFDRIMDKYNIEKIKTIGDAYMAVAGIHIDQLDHAERTILAAQEILDFVMNKQSLFEIRIGIHSGPIVAGVVGVKKFAYDIWGDSVNVASRMESNGLPMHINISQATYELIKDKFDINHRGKIDIKNKGELDMYYLS